MEIVPPTANHKYTVVLLHGRDSDATEFASEFFESQASDDRTLPQIFPEIKWVFPNAGTIRSKGLDRDMNQWFDMFSTQRPHEDPDGQQTNLARANLRTQTVFTNESALVGAENVILGGISQGCAVAACALLLLERRIGGFFGLSSWFPESNTAAEAEGSVNETPVFVGHCQDDDVIAIQYGEQLRDQLESCWFEVEWHRYDDGGHWVNEPQGIDDLVRFISRALKIAPP